MGKRTARRLFQLIGEELSQHEFVMYTLNNDHDLSQLDHVAPGET